MKKGITPPRILIATAEKGPSPGVLAAGNTLGFSLNKILVGGLLHGDTQRLCAHGGSFFVLDFSHC